MKIDLKKPYKRRDGGICCVMEGPGGLFGWYMHNGRGQAAAWSIEGRYQTRDTRPFDPPRQESHPLDIVQVPEKRTVKKFLNVYGQGYRIEVYDHKKDAEDAAQLHAEAIAVPIEFTYEVRSK